MRNSIDALQRQLADREEESSLLETKVRDLRTEVAVRKNLKGSSEESRGINLDNTANTADLKMKKIIARRHLLDSARAQAEEADFLRQELDKLRQRTFPSFVKATKQRNYDIADER